MLDRESSFADDAIVEMVTRSYVPVALDVWYEERRQDAAGDLYRKVVFQREGTSPDRTTQGFYVFAPDGTLLSGWNHRDPGRMKERLRKLQADYRPPKGEPPVATEDPQFERHPPEGGLVLSVHSHIVRADWPERSDRWQEIFRNARGLDHLWVTKAEVGALLEGEFPASLTRRIARFHLIDNTRGEPPMWVPDEVRAAKLALAPGRDGTAIVGAVTLQSTAADRGYDAALRGRLERSGGRITRFDLVARGEYFGEGTYTKGAPPGKFTFAVAFTLAGDGTGALVPPQGARDLHDYLRP